MPLRPEFRLELARVLAECIDATRTHEKLMAGTFLLSEATRAEIAEELAITASKLELLRKEVLTTE